MVQITVNPHDNDRLKTRKVQAMLRELDALPAAQNERPNFLKGERLAHLLIDRALQNIAPVPMVFGASSHKLAAVLANQKFTSAYALPSGDEPLILLDFANGVYTLDGVPTTVGSMLTTDPEAGGAFDEGDIAAGVGYAPPDGVKGEAAFTGEALTRVLAEATILVEFEVGATPRPAQFTMHDPDFNFEYALSYSSTYSITDNFDVANLLAGGTMPIAAGLHKLVVTVENGRIAASLDGGAVVSIAAVAWDPAPTTFWLSIRGPSIFKLLGIYPLQDDADLPSLSAL